MERQEVYEINDHRSFTKRQVFFPPLGENKSDSWDRYFQAAPKSSIIPPGLMKVNSC